jgi:thymidylate synthase ThyX
MIESLMSSTNRHSIPLRELEHASFTFDVLLDQGAYYEVKRHRMMTLTAQPLGTEHGYAIPLLIEKVGLSGEYSDCMGSVKQVFGKLSALNSSAASYVVPNAFNRRFLMTANLRSLVHFVKLREAANAHFSVRRLAQQLSAEIRAAMPLFARYFDYSPKETAAQIENEFFSDIQRR